MKTVKVWVNNVCTHKNNIKNDLSTFKILKHFILRIVDITVKYLIYVISNNNCGKIIIITYS